MSQDFTIHFGFRQLQLLKGDITKIAVDAIVNAANSALAGGGGVDGAIHRAGGPALMRELDQIRAQIGRCETGSAVVTGAGDLPARYVFHAVGPIYQDGAHGEPKQLESCYLACLRLAGERGVESISFPSISAGVYGYPIEAAARTAVKTVANWLAGDAGTLKTIKLVQFSDADHQVYRQQAQELRGGFTAGSAS
jgi:O-acetyl-ADP-ribose deacetylase (regulator of RNase III)